MLRSVRSAPPRKILLGLTALVLFAHWLALGGRLHLWPDRWFEAPSEMGALPNAAPSNASTPDLSSTAPAPAMPAPVTVTSVRWIVPPPPPEPPAPEPTPTPPPPKPVKIAKKPPVVVPEPVIETPVQDPLPVAPTVAAPPEPVQPVEAPVPPPAADLPPPATATVEVPSASATASADNAGHENTASSPVTTVILVPNATLNYGVKGNAKGFHYTASGKLTWQQDGATYKANLEISAFLLGTYAQTSAGRVTVEGLAPERFAIKRRSGEKAAHFERSTGRIRYSSNAPDAPLLPDAQDQLSVTLQLGSLLNTYANLGGARTVSIPVSTDGYSEPWQFEVGAVALLNLPAGNVKARLLKRTPRREHDKTVELWLAPDLGHLPVRMRITEENGDFVDLLLEDLPPLVVPELMTPVS